MVFLKTKLKQSDAIATFLRDTAVHVSQHWQQATSEIGVGIPKSLAKCPDLFDRNYTKLVVLIATYGVGLQAARNLLPSAQAQSIFDCTCAAIEAVYGDESSAQLLSAIDRDWNQALAEGRNPMQSLGTLIFNALDLDDTLEHNGQQIINPVALLALGSVPIRLSCGQQGAWWKMCLKKFRLVA